MLNRDDLGSVSAHAERRSKVFVGDKDCAIRTGSTRSLGQPPWLQDDGATAS
jgi:hypothetical protein